MFGKKHKGSGVGGWLIGTTLASGLAAFVVLRLFDYLRWSAVDGVAAVAKPAVFAGVWTTVTTKLGMRAFSERIQRWRQGIRDRSS